MSIITGEDDDAHEEICTFLTKKEEGGGISCATGHLEMLASFGHYFYVVISIPCFGVIYLLFYVICLYFWVETSSPCKRSAHVLLINWWSTGALRPCASRLRRWVAVPTGQRAIWPHHRGQGATVVCWENLFYNRKFVTASSVATSWASMYEIWKNKKSYHEPWHALIQVRLNSRKMP